MKPISILITIAFALIVIISCNQTSNNSGYANYKELVKNELNSGIRQDTIILGYIFGMTENEVKAHTNKLIQNKEVRKEDDKLIFELQIGDKAVPFSYGTRTYNDKLNFLRAETDNIRAIELNNYLKELYGDYQYMSYPNRKMSMQMTDYYWIEGNRQIRSSQISGAFSETVLIYEDKSNEEPIEAIDISTQQYVNVKVQNDPWDGSVSQVKDYLKDNLKDPKSYESIEWSEVQRAGDNYKVRHKYRAKNSYGGYVIENQVFTINKQGQIIDIHDF